LLLRRVDQSDHRRVRLELTPSGRAVTATSGGSIENLVAGVLRRASPGRLEATTSVLKALVKALESGPVPVGRRPRVQV
jgi:DNA-binding MarR family transcriptional regulator